MLLLIKAGGGSCQRPCTAGWALTAGAGEGASQAPRRTATQASLWPLPVRQTPGEGALSHPCAPCSRPSSSGLGVGWAEAVHVDRRWGSQVTALGAGGLRGHRRDTPFPGEGSWASSLLGPAHEPPLNSPSGSHRGAEEGSSLAGFQNPPPPPPHTHTGAHAASPGLTC